MLISFLLILFALFLFCFYCVSKSCHKFVSKPCKKDNLERMSKMRLETLSKKSINKQHRTEQCFSNWEYVYLERYSTDFMHFLKEMPSFFAGDYTFETYNCESIKYIIYNTDKLFLRTPINVRKMVEKVTLFK